MNNNGLQSIDVGAGVAGRRIAVCVRHGASPGLVWLGGFNSDMNGIKARALDDFAREKGRAMVRFDYSGHGTSGGAFTDGTIGRWLEECEAVFKRFCHGPQVLVGSSMGGWLALLLTRNLMGHGEGRRAKVAGLVLIAPAVDFTEELMWKRMAPEIRDEIEQKGVWAQPSAYSPDPYLITRGLIEEGRDHLLLGGMIETNCPVRILQGVRDEDVPWQHAVDLSARFARDDVVLTLVKDGDHRLSRPEDVARIMAAVAEL